MFVMTVRAKFFGFQKEVSCHELDVLLRVLEDRDRFDVTFDTIKPSKGD